MGQYWIPVNLDKREYVNPHRLGAGLKLWEQLAKHPGTGAALIVLCAAQPEARGGGDFDVEVEWHGPRRKGGLAAPKTRKAYEALARRTRGRWVGDRVALVGDYAQDSDRAILSTDSVPASKIFGLCDPGVEGAWTDVSDDVCVVIAHELGGTFQGDGWRDFVRPSARG